MGETKFDRFLSRAGKTLFLIVMLMIFVPGCWLIYQLTWGFKSWSRQENAVAVVNRQTGKKELLLLGDFSEWSGTSTLHASLYSRSDAGYGSISSGPSGGTIKNHLIFNTVTKSNGWLLPQNSSVFLTSYEIVLDPKARAEDRRSKAPVQKVLFEIIEKDTNGDGDLNDRDLKSLLIYSPAENKLATLLNELDDVLGVEQTTAEETLLFFTAAKKNYAVTLANESGQLGSRIELAPIAAN